MRLSLRLLSILIVVIVGLVVVDGYLSVLREIDLFNNMMRSEAEQLGDILTILISDLWKHSGPENVFRLIRKVNRAEHNIQVRWVWLEAKAGDPYSPRIPRENLQPVTQGAECHDRRP